MYIYKGGKSQQSDLGKIVRLIMERNYDPVIIFSFSKRYVCIYGDPPSLLRLCLFSIAALPLSLTPLSLSLSLLPMPLFRECEAYALKMSKLDFNEESEKDLVEQVFNNAIDSLAEEDKTLPQVS